MHTLELSTSRTTRVSRLPHLPHFLMALTIGVTAAASAGAWAQASAGADASAAIEVNTPPLESHKVFTGGGFFGIGGGNVAIKGYDPVAYFTVGKAVKGTSEFSTEWQDVTWHFSSAANRDAFAADPHAYAPQYGGFCAYAVAQGDLVKIDPSAWSIVDGKLYLNYSAGVQNKWEAEQAAYISDANRQWPDLGRR